MAKALFIAGCLIMAAAGAQIAFAIFSGRTGYAVIGVICAVVALECCRKNWKIWHQG